LYAFVPRDDVLQIVFSREHYDDARQLHEAIADVLGSGMLAFLEGKVVVPGVTQDQIREGAESLAQELWEFARERRLWHVGSAIRRLRAGSLELHHEADRVVVVVNGDLSPVDVASAIAVARSALGKLNEPGWKCPPRVVKEGLCDTDWPPRITADARIPPGCRVDVSLQFETQAGACSEWYGPYANPVREPVAGVPRGYPYVTLKIGLAAEAGASREFVVRGVVCEAEGGRLYYPACLTEPSQSNVQVWGGCLVLVP
jgi:hypothetical protein